MGVLLAFIWGVVAGVVMFTAGARAVFDYMEEKGILILKGKD